MPKVNFIFVAALLLAPVMVEAENPVVVELFTSQGCSSCPPADRLLSRIADNEGVVALALHVDYWDYLGWKDEFAMPAFSDRQRLYARAWHERSVYTPQMVVQGVSYMVGSRGDEIQRQIMQAKGNAEVVALSASNQGAGIRIELVPMGAEPLEADIFLVRYTSGETVMIERGENAGKTIDYVNVVRDWQSLGRWDGKGPAVVNVATAEAGDYVVIIQAPGPGLIYAAALLNH